MEAFWKGYANGVTIIVDENRLDGPSLSSEQNYLYLSRH